MELFLQPILILHLISHKVFPHSGSKIEAPAEVHQTALAVAARKLESLTGRMEYFRPVKPGDAAQFLRRNLPLEKPSQKYTLSKQGSISCNETRGDPSCSSCR